MSSNEVVVVLGVLVAISTFAMLWIMSSRYRRVGPDEALVVVGGRNGTRYVTGGGTFVWPVIEQARVLSLRPITVHGRLPAFHAGLGAPTTLECMAQVKVDGTSKESLELASRLFPPEPTNPTEPADREAPIVRFVSDNLLGHMRQVLGTREAAKIFEEIDPLSAALKAAVADDLRKVGLSVLALTLGSNKESIPVERNPS